MLRHWSQGDQHGISRRGWDGAKGQLQGREAGAWESKNNSGDTVKKEMAEFR